MAGTALVELARQVLQLGRESPSRRAPAAGGWRCRWRNGRCAGPARRRPAGRRGNRPDRWRVSWCGDNAVSHCVQNRPMPPRPPRTAPPPTGAGRADRAGAGPARLGAGPGLAIFQLRQAPARPALPVVTLSQVAPAPPRATAPPRRPPAPAPAPAPEPPPPPTGPLPEETVPPPDRPRQEADLDRPSEDGPPPRPTTRPMRCNRW
jgi:hypothetical protein